MINEKLNTSQIIENSITHGSVFRDNKFYRYDLDNSIGLLVMLGGYEAARFKSDEIKRDVKKLMRFNNSALQMYLAESGADFNNREDIDGGLDLYRCLGDSPIRFSKEIFLMLVGDGFNSFYNFIKRVYPNLDEDYKPSTPFSSL